MFKVGDDIRLLADIEDREGIVVYAERGSSGYVTQVEKTSYLISVADGRYTRRTLRVNKGQVVGA